MHWVTELAAHHTRVARLSVRLGRAVGLPAEARRDLYQAGLAHDSGKLLLASVPWAAARALTEDEWREARLHPEYGASLLRLAGGSAGAARLIHLHHERLDGSGYPLGLRGGDIPLAARVLAVADAFDAMIHRRPYRALLTPAEALARLQAEPYDPEVVAALAAKVSSRITR